MNTIKLSDVKIRKDFLDTVPNEEKAKKIVEYVERHGKIDRPLILNHGVLVDNYIRYLAAKAIGLEEVPYVELHKMNYVVCKFDGNKKEYTWKNDKSLPISVGDKVFVRVGDYKNCKRACVTVVDIFESDDLELFNKHKSVISKLLNNN